MVLYNQARRQKEKKAHFENMLAFRKSDVTVLSTSQYRFYTKWYYTAVREVLQFYRFRGDYKALAKMVIPHISAAQARESIRLLEKLGLIERAEDGSYGCTDKLISTGSKAESVAVNNFQTAMINLAQEAVDRFPRDLRNLSTLSLNVSHDDYLRIVKELSDFRKRALDIAGKSVSADCVFQFNFQIFPLSLPQELIK